MRLTYSFRDLETLSTHELHQLYADLLKLLHHDGLAPGERQQAQTLAGNIRLVLNRRMIRPQIGLYQNIPIGLIKRKIQPQCPK